MAQRVGTNRGGLILVTPWLGSGGIERQIEVVAPWLARQGRKVCVASWNISKSIDGVPNPVLQTLGQAGVSVKALAARGRLQLFQRAVRVAAFGLRHKFSTVLGYDIEGNIVAALAKLISARRIRACASFHVSTESYAAFGLSPAKRRLATCLFRHVDGFVGVSEGISREAIAYYNLDPNRVTTIANPIRIEKIIAASRTAIGSKVDKLKPFILGCGRLNKLKRFEDLIIAFKSICELPLLKRYKVVILGSGPHLEALLALVKSLDLSDQIIFPGFSSNPYQYFAHSKAFVLSSETEALPTVLIEAMACGTPVIATRCRWGPEEILDYGKYGLLYNVGDTQALASRIVQVIQDDVETAQRVEAARRRSLDFSESCTLQNLEVFLFNHENATY